MYSFTIFINEVRSDHLSSLTASCNFSGFNNSRESCFSVLIVHFLCIIFTFSMALWVEPSCKCAENISMLSRSHARAQNFNQEKAPDLSFHPSKVQFKTLQLLNITFPCNFCIIHDGKYTKSMIFWSFYLHSIPSEVLKIYRKTRIGSKSLKA